MTWTDLTFNYGAVLTSTQMTQLDDNFEALANGDSGAPSIQTAAIANSAVTNDKLANDAVTNIKVADDTIHRAELYTDTASTSGSVSSGGVADINLNAYSFFPMIHGEQSPYMSVIGHSVDGASADNPSFGFYNAGGTSRTYDVDHRYVRA